MYNVLSLYDGIGAARLALDRALIPVLNFYKAEIDKFPSKVTQYHFPNDINFGDVTNWKEWNLDWGSIDIVFAGFPCFTKETLVLTKNGYKPISIIEKEDIVLTHTNTWKPVTHLFEKENTIWEIQAKGLVKTNTTDNHPFLISKMIKEWDDLKKEYVRSFSEPTWVKVKDIEVDDFICFPKIKKEQNIFNLTEKDCFNIGRYLVDDFYLTNANERLVGVLKNFCNIKQIHPTLLELPSNLLEKVINGLFYKNNIEKQNKITFVSKDLELINSLLLAIMKVYNVICNVNEKYGSYILHFNKTINKNTDYVILDDYFISPVKMVLETKRVETVYSLEVDEDNSYTVNNAIVHNCQSWSLAGKQLGDKDERGQLFWVTLDIIKHIKSKNPNVKFLLENVKMKKEFEEYITTHTEEALGKVNKILVNSALVSAQNRQRYYWTNWETTQPEPVEVYVKDILEENPPQKYELSDEAIAYMSRLRNGLPRWEYHKNPLDGKAACLTANMYKGVPYGVLQIKCGAFRGRYKIDGVRQDAKMKTAGLTKQELEVRNDGKTNCLTTVQKDNVAVFEVPSDNKIFYRRLTPTECARLQTFPDYWCNMLSDTQQYKAYGNSWTVDVVAHLLKDLKKELDND